MSEKVSRPLFMASTRRRHSKGGMRSRETPMKAAISCLADMFDMATLLMQRSYAALVLTYMLLASLATDQHGDHRRQR